MVRWKIYLIFMIDTLVDIDIAVLKLFPTQVSVQTHNHTTHKIYIDPVWHGSNSGWSCSTPELQVEPVLVGVGALGGASSRWSRSYKRGAPKLYLHLHYSSIELAAPWSFGVGVFGWKIGWSCWSSAPEPCQTPPKCEDLEEQKAYTIW